jgi:hypothetical protein
MIDIQILDISLIHFKSKISNYYTIFKKKVHIFVSHFDVYHPFLSFYNLQPNIAYNLQSTYYSFSRITVSNLIGHRLQEKLERMKKEKPSQMKILTWSRMHGFWLFIFYIYPPTLISKLCTDKNKSRMKNKTFNYICTIYNKRFFFLDNGERLRGHWRQKFDLNEPSLKV